MSDKYAVWWLNQQEVTAVYSSYLIDTLPGYIQTQVRSASGRPGRGRLWVPPDIPINDIGWPEQAWLQGILKKCAGIVVMYTDTPQLIRMPGTVTDLGFTILGG